MAILSRKTPHGELYYGVSEDIYTNTTTSSCQMYIDEVSEMERQIEASIRLTKQQRWIRRRFGKTVFPIPVNMRSYRIHEFTDRWQMRYLKDAKVAGYL